MAETLASLEKRIKQANRQEFSLIEKELQEDTRVGVQRLLERRKKALKKEGAEYERVMAMYEYEARFVPCSGDGIVVGLDEVGRGCIAGPLCVGAVVLPRNLFVEGLNDSKQLSPEKRQSVARAVQQDALAYATAWIDASVIDEKGIMFALKSAMKEAIAHVEAQGIIPDVVLIDGLPLGIDEREVTVVKGDARCASIAAASVIAKVSRDAYMCSEAVRFPEYHFEQHKGYGSAAHIEAIETHGLCLLHRKSFCTRFNLPDSNKS